MLLLLRPAERQHFLRSIGSHPPASQSMQTRLAHLIVQGMEGENHPSTADQFPENEALWQQLRPGETFKPSYFKNLLSDVQADVEQFLVQQHLAAHVNVADTLCLKALLTRGASYDLLTLLWRAAFARLSAADGASSQQPAERQQLWELALAIERRNPDRRRLKSAAAKDEWPQDPTTAVVQALDETYLIAKIKLACDDLLGGQPAVASTSTALLPLAQLLAPLQGIDLSATPLLQLHLQCYQLLMHGQGYAAYKMTLLESKLPLLERFSLVIHAQNYCIWKGNAGDRAYLQEYVGWMDYRQQQGLLLLDGQLPPSEFKNYITACLKLGELPKAKDFLSRFGPQIHSDFREKAIAFNEAHIAYSEEKLSIARKILAAHPVLDQYDELDWRSLQLKIHCAHAQTTHDQEDLFAFLHSFRNFLYRTKILPPPRVKAHLLKLSYVEKIFKNPKPTRLKKLRAEVLEHEGVADREWVAGLVGVG